MGQRVVPLAGWVLLALAAVVALTWTLERVIPPPYSGYLALIAVGLVLTERLRRQPRQRALRLLHVYFRARERGADERAARDALLGWLVRDADARARLARDLDPHWTGASERDRVLGGVGAVCARRGWAIKTDDLVAAYARARDRFTIPGWEALPPEFVDHVRRRLEARDLAQLDALAEKYRLFHQRFFRQPTALALDPAASVVDFARLLHSLGNRLTPDEPGDAERAYRLSLRLRPEANLAHAGLALLLQKTGRVREAAREARDALEALDAHAAAAPAREPVTEDISPFRSPKALRAALEQVAADEG